MKKNNNLKGLISDKEGTYGLYIVGDEEVDGTMLANEGIDESKIHTIYHPKSLEAAQESFSTAGIEKEPAYVVLDNKGIALKTYDYDELVDYLKVNIGRVKFKYLTKCWVYFEWRFTNKTRIPIKTSNTKVTLIIAICSIKGVWVERFAEKMDHQVGSEKVIADTVSQMMNKEKIDSQYNFTSFTSLKAQGVLSFLIARKGSSSGITVIKPY